MAALALVLAIPAVAQVATRTTLNAETRDLAGRTHAALQIAVAGDGEKTASGAVQILDRGSALAGAQLDAAGKARIELELAPGAHQLAAVYQGDGTHRASASASTAVQAQTSGTPSFSVSINPASLSLTAGDSRTVKVSVTPINPSALTAPMFVSVTCSNIPDQSACTFTPQNVEIDPNTKVVVQTSEMVFTTQAASGATGSFAVPARSAGPTALALLFPGMLALGGLAWGARRRRYLSRLSLVALFALITLAGATGCNPQYYYKNHGPIPNLPTPPGNYTVTITGQSTNGVSAITAKTTMALTVK